MEISKHLLSAFRRRPLRPLCYLSTSFQSRPRETPSSGPQSPLHSIPSHGHYNFHLSPSLNLFTASHFMHFRSLSTRSDPVKEFQNEGLNIGDHSELLKLEGGDGGSEVVQGVIDSAGSDELILPVRAVISLLDGLRDVTDLPW